MTWQIWLQVIGWLGSALLVFSVIQSKFLRFRILNGVASLVLVAYNALLLSWPQVAMNAVLVLVDAYFLVTLLREQRSEKAFSFVSADAELANWFWRAHEKDIRQFHPGFGEALATAEVELLFHQERAIGLVAFNRSEASASAVELVADYVIPAYRDYAPGAFVYSSAGPLAACGVKRLAVTGPRPAVATYLSRMGYERDGDLYTKHMTVM